MIMSPQFSVVLVAFGRREFLREAVESVLNSSTFTPPLEVIILTNFPTSETRDLLNGLDTRATKLRFEFDAHPNVGQTLVHAASIAKGDILVLLDDDDLFLPEKLSHVQATFTRNPDIDYYHNNFELFGRTTRSSPTFPEAKRLSRVDSTSTLRFLSQADREENMSSTVVRRALVLDYQSVLSRASGLQDTLLFFCALVAGKVMVFDPAVLTKVRSHTRNTSNSMSDLVRRTNSWKLIREIVLATPGNSGLMSYYNIRLSRSVIYDHLLGARKTRQELWVAIMELIRALRVSGPIRTSEYVFLGALGIVSPSLGRGLRPFLTR